MPKLKQEHLVIFWLVLYLFSMVYSKFLLSISMFGIGFSALFPLNESTGRPKWRGLSIKDWSQFLQKKGFAILGLMVVAYLLSGINSSDLSEWWWRVRTKSPFFLIPFAFSIYRPWSVKVYRYVLISFMALMTLSSAYILFQFFTHQEQMVLLLKVGKHIPTPCNHIRYSLMLALAGAVSAYLLLFQKWSVPRWISSTSLIVVTVALHVLSVRSGLICFYLAMFWLAFYKILTGQRKQWAFALFFIVALTPVTAYYTMPSFKQKVDYVKYDFEQFQKNGGQNYSDAERIMSYRAGWYLFKSHPILGVGMGDLLNGMKTYYQENYNREKAKFPHNQYLFVLAGCGILGFLIFFTGFFAPLLMAKSSLRGLQIGCYIILAASFMVENTLETAVGTAISIFFVVIFIKEHYDANHNEVLSHEVHKTA